jgi:hypothetical protein
MIYSVAWLRQETDMRGNPNVGTLNKKGQAYTPSRLTPEEFVVIWNSSRSIEDFEARTSGQVTRAGAFARAKTYRKKGIKLKYMGNNLQSIERMEEVKQLAAQTVEVWDVDSILKQYTRKK